jgi:hypothetical protein
VHLGQFSAASSLAQLLGRPNPRLVAHAKVGEAPMAAVAWPFRLAGGEVSWGGHPRYQGGAVIQFWRVERKEAHRREQSTVAALGRRGFTALAQTRGRWCRLVGRRSAWHWGEALGGGSGGGPSIVFGNIFSFSHKYLFFRIS